MLDAFTQSFSRLSLSATSISAGILIGKTLADTITVTNRTIYDLAKCFFTPPSQASFSTFLIENHPLVGRGLHVGIVKTVSCNTRSDLVIHSAITYSVTYVITHALFIELPQAFCFSPLSQKFLLITAKTALISTLLFQVINQLQPRVNSNLKAGIVIRRATQRDRFSSLLRENHPGILLYSLSGEYIRVSYYPPYIS